MLYFIKEGGKRRNGFSIQTDGAWDWSFHLRISNTLRTIRKRGDRCKRSGVEPKWLYKKITLSADDVLCSELLDRFGWDGVRAFRSLEQKAYRGELT